ncbi:MAG: hypothetical protein K2L19_06050 [Eubacterium sp.]|nr:hypothetical protein [Eubacterium sp.]
MNNRELYKDVMSGVRHSDDAIERIFDMTVDKKKANNKPLFKRLACAALAFAVLAVGGGVGANTILQNNKAGQPLTVMVAYASDNGKLSFGSKHDQPLFYGLYLAPYDDPKACKEAAARWQADKTKVLNQLDNKAEGSSGSYGSGGLQCYNIEQEKETAYCYTLEGGSFELDLKDYTDVKSFKVNNESEYGLLHFEYADLEWHDKVYYDDSEIPEEFIEYLKEHPSEDHEFTLTGDEIRFSQNTGDYNCGLGKYETNKGYFLTWLPSEELGYAIGENPHFDLSQIKDTITFTLEYNDGTIKSASLNLYFDSDGYMHFEQ